MHTTSKIVSGLVAVLAIVPCCGNTALGQASTLIEHLENGESQTVVVYGTSLTAGGAWVPQITSSLNAQYPGKITWVNSGLSGKASNSGVASLQTQVLNHNPDAVFIEFGMNDAFIAYEEGNIDKDISVEQARSNLESMIDDITTQDPNTQVILQTMNPSWDAPNGNGSGSKRPNLAAYYQMYRDVAEERSLTLVDNNRVWLNVQSNELPEFQARVSDGTHPDSTGYQRYVTSAVLYQLGANLGPSLVVDTQTGRALLDNQSAGQSEIIAYTISSAAGALLTDWTGLAALEPGVWQKANPTTNNLSELTGGDALKLAPGEVRDLGLAWDTTASLNLQFRYQTPDGALNTGHIIFLDDTSHLVAMLGDYNGDGTVDAADYTVWRDHLNEPDESALHFNGDGGGVGPGDYLLWRNHFGETSAVSGHAAGSATAVPEPSAAMLALLTAAVAPLRRRMLFE